MRGGGGMDRKRHGCKMLKKFLDSTLQRLKAYLISQHSRYA
jgi:hypothetical protein